VGECLAETPAAAVAEPDDASLFVSTRRGRVVGLPRDRLMQIACDDA
jgi:hypothetical protein